MPCNLYGLNDSHDLENSHVIPALLQKTHAATRTQDTVTVWGSGTPRREFLHVDDLADALVYLMKHYNESGHINVGSGYDISIRGLAALIGEIAGFKGNFIFDTSKPDGTPQKLLDSTRINQLGWKAKIPLAEGLSEIYQNLSKPKAYAKAM